MENSTEDGQILMILSNLVKYFRRPFAVRYHTILATRLKNLQNIFGKSVFGFCIFVMKL
jgi:hypothetical protein